MLTLRPGIDQFVPDDLPVTRAAARTTHFGIGAHPDDLEILAFPGIADCYEDDAAWFTGVVVCDGAGSPRAGRYADYSDDQMAACRREEQRSAARLGRYSLLLQLGYTSEHVKNGDPQLIDDLVIALETCRPDVLFLHNPADAHATHRATLRACIAALRRLDANTRPERIYGVEVWRSLDWLPDGLRRSLPIDDPQQLQARLLRCHDSQISGGKRYDQAILARQRANATLAATHGIDAHDACVLAMDLRAFVADTALSERDLLANCLRAFSAELLKD